MAAPATSKAAPGRRALGPWMATALVVGNMIGSGVFLLPASMAPYGAISIVGWLATAVGAFLLALVFSRLGRMMPRIGGPYAYARAGFGEFIGFQMAWGYWIAIWGGNAAIVVAFVGYLAYFWPALGEDPVLGIAAALAAVWLLTALNASGIRQGGLVQIVTTVLKLIPLLLVATAGWAFVDGANFTPFNPTGESDLAAASATATLALWAFIGLESATVPAEDVRDPERTIPRATLFGTLATAAIYILGTVAVLGIVPPAELGTSTAPFADAARAMFGDWAGALVALGAVISTFGCLNGWIILQGQIPLAAARDGVFPALFARTTTSGTPVVGLAIGSVLISALMALNYTKGLVEQFTFIILLATLTALVPYLYATMAELMIFIRERPRLAGQPLSGAVVVAVLAFVYALWTIIGAGAETVFWGAVLIFAGTPVYVLLRWRAGAGAVDQPAE